MEVAEQGKTIKKRVNKMKSFKEEFTKLKIKTGKTSTV